MSWLDKLPWRKQKQNTKWADMLNGYAPIFSQFGDNIFASDVVQQAMNCIVSEMKKLNPSHVRILGVDEKPVVSNLQRVLNNPNEFMTRSEYIEKIIWSLLSNLNAFIIPTYYLWEDENGNFTRVYTGLYPVQPRQVDFIEDASGTMYIKFRFANNHETTLPYSDVIHIRRNYSANEFMGGDEQGQPNNDSLLKSLQINETLLEGVAEAMKSSFAINGVVKYNTLMDKGKTEQAIKDFEAQVKKSESGILALDQKAEYISLSRDVKLVDTDTLKFIDEKILRSWGVPLCILTGDYTKAQYEAFYQKTLEPLIIALSQAHTKTLFTPRERSFGNEIKFYPKDLIFMSVEQTIEMVRLLGDAGELYSNEKRTAFGLQPLKELEGVRMQSLNYVNVDIATQYQLQEKNTNVNINNQQKEEEVVESD